MSASVKSVTKVHDARLTRDTSGCKVYVNYRVEFDGVDNEPTQCIGAVDPVTSLAIPGKGSTIGYTIEDDVGIVALMTSFEPKQQTPLVYTVLVTYDPIVAAPDENGNWDLTFAVRGVPVIVEVGKDKDGNPMLNSAGEPFKGIKRTIYDEEITITWKTNTPPVDDIEANFGCINSASCSFTINGVTRSFDALTLKMTDGEYNTTTTGETKYWNVSIKFLNREDGWADEVIDEGTYYLASDGSHIEAPTGGTVLLDGSGHQLPDGTDPVTIDFNLDNQTDFTGMLAGL